MTDKQAQELDRDSHAYLAYAEGDAGFAFWIKAVDDLCWRMLRHSFFDIEDLVHSLDCYRDGCRPGEFFSNILINVMEYEMGCVDLPEIIFHNVMWGGKQL